MSAMMSARLAKIHSRIVNGGADLLPPRPETCRIQQEPKLLDVSITILSLTGFRAAENKDRMNTATDSNKLMSNAVNMVASFENGATAESSNDIPMTHLPSLSFQLPTTSFNRSSTFCDIVSWPEQAAEAEFANMSSFQFQREFAPEGETGRLKPQVCPIQISVSRNGNMHKLGVASVLVNGEESGEFSTIIPIASDEEVFNPGLDELIVPMVPLKGDTMKCSLDRNSSIRVLVKVSDPHKARTHPIGGTLAGGTDFTMPVSHFLEAPVLSAASSDFSAASSECDEVQSAIEIEVEKEAVTFDMFYGETLPLTQSKKVSFGSDTTDASSDYTSAFDSHPSSTDDEFSFWSFNPSDSNNTSIAKKLKDELLNGGWLGSPKSDSASASLDDTTVSSSGSITAGSSISKVDSIRKPSPTSNTDRSSTAKGWINRFACGLQLCGSKHSDDDETLLHSAVVENVVLLDTYDF